MQQLQIHQETLGLRPEDSPSVRDSLNVLETIVRAIYCLAVPTYDRNGSSVEKVTRNIGYRGYISRLRQIPVIANPVLAELIVKQSEIANTTLGGRSIADWRNLLSHGGISPADGSPFQHNQLHAIVRTNVELFNETFADWSAQETHSGILTPVDTPHGSFENPLIVSAGESWGFLHSATKTSITYFLFDRKRSELEAEYDNDLSHNVLKFIGFRTERTNHEDSLRLFRSCIRDDTRAFSESESVTFDISSDTTPFVVQWTRRAGEELEPRTDIFDLSAGAANFRWKSEDGEYRPYVDFIKNISRWDILGNRLLEQAEAQDQSELNTTNGLLMPRSGFYPNDRYINITGGVESSSSDGCMGISELSNTLDDYAARQVGSPQVLFLSGEAGLGKTRTLLDLTLERSRRLADPSFDGPAYIYIDLASTQLSSLPKAIDSAVSKTFLLNSGRVFTLCRNGLAVLIIDGFDELVGGAGYRDAFGALQDTIEGLGHSGTLLISARSSYGSNQYAASLNRALSTNEKLVQHEQWSLQPWSADQVNQIFNERKKWLEFSSYLSSDERSLLGLPYFARVFDDAIEQRRIRPDSRINLIDLLLDAYIDREIQKLARVGGGIIDKEHLSEILIEAAHILQTEIDGAMTESDFLDLAMLVLEIDVTETSGKRDVLDRMTVLCGTEMRSSGVSTSAKQFAFEHELYQDSLAGRWISNRLLETERQSKRGQEKLLLESEFKKSTYSRSVIRSLISSVSQSFLGDALGELCGQGYEKDSSISANTALATSEFINSHRSLGSIRDCINLSFDSLTISCGVGYLGLTNCSVEYLVIDDNPDCSGDLNLVNTDIRSLEFTRAAGSPTQDSPLHVTVDSGTSIQRVIERNDSGVVVQMLDNPRDIFGYLMDMQWSGAEVRRAEYADTADSPLFIFAHRIFTWLASRNQRMVIVLDSSSIPGDTASHGVPDPNNPLWSHLVRISIENGLAERRRFAASGSAKAQIVFSTSPDDILNTSSSEEVIEFWKSIR